MTLFAVIREAGPGWTEGKGAFEQPAINEHAGFMYALSDRGILQFAGPLAGTEHDRIRALLIVDADSEGDIHRHLADDPWTLTDRLVVTSIEPWTLMVGAERLGAQPAGQ